VFELFILIFVKTPEPYGEVVSRSALTFMIASLLSLASNVCNVLGYVGLTV
jgi:hypothetical protein